MRSLSLIVPVYEAHALARSLIARLGEFERAAQESGFELVETILVDDGAAVPLDAADAPGRGVRVIRNETNRGKGFSVRRGMLEAKGEWALMSDVDLSAPPKEFARLAEQSGAWMVCGVRRGRKGMPLRRRMLSRAFVCLARLAGVRGVSDTQCGFKLFRMDAMRGIFRDLRTERFAFDVELIGRVHRAGGEVREVPVEWHGGKRSSLRLFRDGPVMLRDLLKIRRMLRSANRG